MRSKARRSPFLRAPALLLLLVPLALLGTALLGLLAQSASAHDTGAVTPPSLTAPPPPSSDPTPDWSFTLPANDPGTADPTTAPATGTVTIRHDYSAECAYGRTNPPTTFAACTSPYVGSTSTDGDYFLAVRTVETTTSTFVAEGTTTAVDTSLGERRSTEVVSSFSYDGNAPVVTVEASKTGSGRSPTFTVSVQDGSTSSFTCTVTGSATCAPGAGVATLDLTGQPDGVYTMTVTATDLGGRVTEVSRTYTLGAFVVGATGPTTGRSSTPTWTYTGSTAAGSTCNITGAGATVTCDATGVTANLPTGPTTGTTYTVTATVVDTLGNSQTLTLSYLLDNKADLAVATPPSPSNDTTPRWTFTTGEAVTVSCALTADGAPVTVTGSTCDATGYQAGILTGASGTSYVLTVTASDALGNPLTLTAAPYVLDTTPATLSLNPAQQPVDTVRTPSWTLSGDTAFTQVACTFTRGGTPVSGGSCSDTGFTADLSGEADGDFVLTITGKDAAGNDVNATTGYTLDTSAPSATAVSPSVTGRDRSPTFSFTFESGARTVTCALVGTVSGTRTTDCTVDLANGSGSFTPADLPLTDEETWSFTLTVTDQAGNTTTSTPVTYRLDTTTPTATATSPAITSNGRTPTFTFGFESGAASVTCALRNTAGQLIAGACTRDLTAGSGSFTPTAALPLSPGEQYTFTITVSDAAGNTTTSAPVGYLLDTSAPAVTATAPAAKDDDRSPTFTSTFETGARTATCALVNGSGADVLGTCTVDLTAGTASFTPAAPLPSTPGETYVFTVTVTDQAGNPASASATYRLDSVAELAAGTPPASPGSDTTPTWAFTSEPGPGVTVTCRLTSAAGVAYDGPCTSATSFTPPTALPPTSGTTYTLVVTVVDALGNTSSLTMATYLLDTVADLTVTVPSSPSSDTTPTWTLTPETGASATCALAGPGAPAREIDCSAGTFTPPALPGTLGADYVLTITVTDALGNVTVHVQPTYRLDTVLPVATITVPTSPSRQTTVVWTVAADEALTSATCELRRDGVVVQTLTNCPGSTTVTVAGDGRYDVVVTLVDLAGNTSTTASTVLVHDATVPTAPVLSPTQTTTNSTTATWTVTGEGGTAVTTCRVTLAGVVVQDWTTCSGTFSVPLPRDGEYLLEAVSTDPVGPGPISTATYLLDTVLPVAPTVSGPTGPSPSRSPSWSVGAEPGTSTECRLVRGGTVVSDWAPCAGGFTAALDGAPDGAYVLESRATDAAQNVGPVGASAPYVLDTTAPLPPVVSGPSGPSQLRNPAFSWTGEAGTTAQCQLSLDGTAVGGWVACTSGVAPTLSKDGTWTLAVRLTDAAGNVSDTATTGGYVLDTTAPATPVVTPPKTPGRDLAPSWGAVVESGTSLECRLSGVDGLLSDWTPCLLPLTTPLADRPDGAYVLDVRATDAAGNLSPVGSGTYVLDTVVPAAAVITSPAGGRSRTPTFTFTVEPGATTRCRLTSGTTVVSDFAACTTPVPLDLTGLPDGTYTLTVRVVDAAGNPGPAATGTYVLDTTGPAAPVLTLTPASPSPARSLTYAFTYEPGSTLICRLTFPTGAVREITGCASPLTIDLSGLPDGSYTLTVRAVDAAGNVGATLTEVHVLDSTALAPPTVTGPVTPGSTPVPRWTVTGTSTECRLTRGTTVLRDWAACSGSFTADLFGQPDGTYVLSARSKDASGAVSAATQSRYVLDTTPPGAATVVAPPSPSTNRTPTWTIASSELGATAECRVLVFGSVLRDWAPCAVTPSGGLYALDLAGAGDGTYTLVVRLIDAAGNRSTVETRSAFVLDTSAPVAVGITGPPTPGNDVTPTWVLSSGAGAVLECRLTSAAGVISDWAPCAGEYVADLTGLPDGIYTLAVRALSAAGTPGPDTTSAYELNTSAPTAPTALALVSGIRSTDNDRSPAWTFTLPPGTKAHCRVVRGETEVFDGPCSSPFRLDLSGAQDGSYRLTVQAISAAGTRGAAATSTYVLDTEPTAEPVFTQRPGSTGSTLDPQWRFSVAFNADPQCRLLLGGTPLDDWAACQTPFTAQLTGRPDGTYVLQVRAIDTAGNTSEPVSDAYVLDRTAAPVPTFTATPPATGSDRTVTWSFVAPEGTTLECRVVGPDGTATTWGACGPATAALRLAGRAALAGGTYALDLTHRADGLWTLQVRAVETDGRTGAAASATYRLDTRRPEMPSYSGLLPGATGSDPNPVWVWDLGTDELVECRLLMENGSAVTAWQECAESQYRADLRRLGEGTYVLQLRVTDAAGNVSLPRSAAYLYDTTAPEPAAFTSRPPSSGSDRTVSWTFSAVDGQARCTITRDRTRVAEGPCSGRYDLNLAGLPDGVYTLTVTVTDAAGNPSTPASSTYSLRTVGLAGPVRVDLPGRAPDTPVVDREPTGPGRAGTGVVGTPPLQGSAPGPGVPIDSLADVVRASQNPPTSAPQQQEVPAPQPEPEPTESNPLLPGPIPVEDVGAAVREIVTGTVAKPTLPLALLAIVFLFLLAQNRIDRRDPKLATAPVEAEPELDFTAFVRRPGSAFS